MLKSLFVAVALAILSAGCGNDGASSQRDDHLDQLRQRNQARRDSMQARRDSIRATLPEFRILDTMEQMTMNSSSPLHGRIHAFVLMEGVSTDISADSVRTLLYGLRACTQADDIALYSTIEAYNYESYAAWDDQEDYAGGFLGCLSLDEFTSREDMGLE